MQGSANQRTSQYFWWILIGITIFAFGIRLVSIDHNLPNQIISDEGSDLTTAVRLLQGELPARHVRYHRSLIAYNNIIPITGVFLLNVIDGDVRSIEDFQNLYFANRAEFIFAVRVWMSFLTSMSIFFTGLAASYIHRRIGLLAALILCLNGFYFHTSLFALPDALGASMTALAIWAMMRVWKYRRTQDYILMSLSLALVMLAKLQAAPIGIGFLIAHAYISYDAVNGNWKRLPLQYIRDRNFWIAALTGIMGNLIFNPFAFFFIDDFIFEITRLRGMMYGSENLPFSYQFDLAIMELTNLVLVVWRWMSLFMLLAFMAIWQYRKKAPYVMIAAMILLLSWTVLSSRLSPLSHFYYWNPVVVVMAIMASIGINYVIEFLQSLNKRFALTTVIAVISIVVGLEGSFLWHMFSIMNQKTTQELAREWVVENIPADTAILIGEPIVISVPLQRNILSIENAIPLGRQSLPQWTWYLEQAPENHPNPAYTLYGSEYVAIVDSYADLVELIEIENIDYAIFADYDCNLDDDDPRNDSARAFPPRGEDVIGNWELVFSSSSFASGGCEAAIHPRTKIAFSAALYQQIRSGPYIEIYHIP